MARPRSNQRVGIIVVPLVQGLVEPRKSEIEDLEASFFGHH
jgi:hypothetical protein